MKVTQEAIQRFFNNQCSPEEGEQVYQYLYEHPEVIDQYINIEEWAQFTPEQNLAEDTINRMAATIQAAQQPAVIANSKPLYIRWLKPVAAAASILLVIGAGYFLLGKRTTPAAIPTPLAATYDTIINKKNRTVRTTLPDSTVVELSPYAELVYKNDYNSTRRDLQLKGEAVFHVAHNKNKPFTVFAGDIATTALGTVFRVITKDSLNQTHVYLLEGKVVVRPDSALLAAGVKTTFLSPGQELSFNNASHQAVVKAITNKPAAVAAVPAQAAVPFNPVVTFDNQPLPIIFNNLQRIYKTNIHCNKAELENITFTGSFNTSEQPLEKILKKITDLNSLQLTVTQSGYTIQ